MVNHVESLLLETRQLYEAMYRFDAAAAAELGIHLSDLRCVNALENGPLTAGAIGERLGLTSGSVTALINRLEAAGFVVKRRSKADGRQVQVQLKPKFYQQADAIYARLGRSVSSQFQELSVAEIEQAIATINRLAAGFDQAD
ncbi:MarR family transcriptional regulator [filamentous cyanobacterium LEGE 11480]|uniref:MarR family transcriptional regulator n=1 Tax=Romeriopsis navalis LEGE 11480 TaxID=2777977 RepID=A0A928VLH1_9CYAN|nr:MarR family transcriptional regulator [Romeriopsis navalis]MBE9030510.1 MarR family transcriptional regulator [Romeriopsis navalis LEGE 11480]